MEEKAADPTFVIVDIDPEDFDRKGGVYVLPWDNRSGQAVELLNLILRVGVGQARTHLQQAKAQELQLPEDITSSLPWRIHELVGAQYVSVYDETCEVRLLHLENHAPLRGYVSTERWQDPVQKYSVKNSVMDSSFIMGPGVNHIVLLRSTSL